MENEEENYYDDLEGPEEEFHRRRPQQHLSPSKDKHPELVYRPDTHTSEAFSRFQEMKTVGRLCDVVVKVGHISIEAHRVVLAACSPYFRAMFSGNMRESREGVVTIKEFDPEAVRRVVEFCYRAVISIDMANVFSVLPVANLLQMIGVQEACCQFLGSQLHPSNCLGIRGFADLHNCQGLWKKCTLFMQQRFPEIALHEEFLELEFEEVKEIISDGNLNVRGEEQVYEAAMAWLKHDETRQTHHLAELLGCVRMPLMSATYLSREVKNERLVMDNYDGRGLLISAMDHHLQKHYLRNSQTAVKSINTTPRRCPGLECLFAIGGSGPPVFEDDPYLDLCECYDPEKDEWRVVAPMSVRRSGMRVASLGGYLYSIGGFSASDTKALSVVERYDPMTDSWRLMSSMLTPRRSFGVAVLNGYIYSMGGINGGTYYDSVERYCPRSNKWSFVQPMSVERRAVTAASLDGFVYVAGGHDGEGLLDTVERFNPEQDTWTIVTNLSSPRCLGALVSIKGFLYAVGGYDGASVLQSLQVC
jgi:kelch-like protein 17 (actinfilin)